MLNELAKNNGQGKYPPIKGDGFVWLTISFFLPFFEKRHNVRNREEELGPLVPSIENRPKKNRESEC